VSDTPPPQVVVVPVEPLTADVILPPPLPVLVDVILPPPLVIPNPLRQPLRR
jgi:hypothetical protein